MSVDETGVGDAMWVILRIATLRIFATIKNCGFSRIARVQDPISIWKGPLILAKLSKILIIELQEVTMPDEKHTVEADVISLEQVSGHVLVVAVDNPRRTCNDAVFACGSRAARQ